MKLTHGASNYGVPARSNDPNDQIIPKRFLNRSINWNYQFLLIMYSALNDSGETKLGDAFNYTEMTKTRKSEKFSWG